LLIFFQIMFYNLDQKFPTRVQRHIKVPPCGDKGFLIDCFSLTFISFEPSRGATKPVYRDTQVCQRYFKVCRQVLKYSRCQFHQLFSFAFFIRKFVQSQNIIRKRLSYVKFAHLTLMKLTIEIT